MNNLPVSLQRPLAEVTNYVGKMPSGVSLTELNNKVNAYQKIDHKEKFKLIGHISKSGNILVFWAKKNETSNPRTFLFHKKFGYPKKIDGYPLIANIKDAFNNSFCWSCNKEKPLKEFGRRNTLQRPSVEICGECIDKKLSDKKEIEKEIAEVINPYRDEISRIQDEGNYMEKPLKTAEQLRREAEELLKAADEAERKAQSNDYVNKTIKPLIHSALQEATKIQKNVDDLITNTANFEKSISELRKIMI